MSNQCLWTHWMVSRRRQGCLLPNRASASSSGGGNVLQATDARVHRRCARSCPRAGRAPLVGRSGLFEDESVVGVGGFSVSTRACTVRSRSREISALRSGNSSGEALAHEHRRRKHGVLPIRARLADHQARIGPFALVDLGLHSAKSRSASLRPSAVPRCGRARERAARSRAASPRPSLEQRHRQPGGEPGQPFRVGEARIEQLVTNSSSPRRSW